MNAPKLITDWLENLGLGQYAQRFAENDITLAILPDLTDQDLEKIGVASLGHRRLLLREIASLDKSAAAARSAPPPTAPAVAAPPSNHSQRVPASAVTSR
jgi:hypothetical protein